MVDRGSNQNRIRGRRDPVYFINPFVASGRYGALPGALSSFLAPLSPLLSGVSLHELCDELWPSCRCGSHHRFQHGVHNSVLIRFGNLQDLEFLHVQLPNSILITLRGYLVPRFRNLRTPTYHIAR